MADEEQLAVLRQGSDAWNAWREHNPGVYVDLLSANLEGADLSEANLSGAHLSQANLVNARLFKANLFEARLDEASLVRANLYNADLSGATLAVASLEGAYLVEAVLRDADLTDANLIAANLQGAKLVNANLAYASLGGANLSKADLCSAKLTGAYLEQAILVGTDFTGADLTDCRVYGISAWDPKLEGATQKDLIITPHTEPEITVDNLEVAQFIYLLLNNEKLRDVIDTITTKAVLILGRFTPERKAVLDALREGLRKRDRTPIVFDFDQPENKNITDTVKLLAQLARYIIVDLSDPNSAPYELGVISMLGLDSTPMVPLIASGQRPFPMLDDVLRKRWSTQLVRYQGLDDVKANLDEMLIKIAEAKVQELRRASPPAA